MIRVVLFLLIPLAFFLGRALTPERTTHAEGVAEKAAVSPFVGIGELKNPEEESPIDSSSNQDREEQTGENDQPGILLSEASLAQLQAEYDRRSNNIADRTKKYFDPIEQIVGPGMLPLTIGDGLLDESSYWKLEFELPLGQDSQTAFTFVELDAKMLGLSPDEPGQPERCVTSVFKITGGERPSYDSNCFSPWPYQKNQIPFTQFMHYSLPKKIVSHYSQMAVSLPDIGRLAATVAAYSVEKNKWIELHPARSWQPIGPEEHARLTSWNPPTEDSNDDDE